MKTKAYNLNYRPGSYWNHSDPLQTILSGISSRARREMITDYWNAGKIDQLCPELLQDELSGEERRDLGRISPFFMGGEYLPSRLPWEVTIVTIQLESTTYDVIELRARPLSSEKIGLRWVDEYETDFKIPMEIIDQPFTFGELIKFIEGSGPDGLEPFPIAYNEMNRSCYGDACYYRDFTTFSSDFYPELFSWADSIIANWVNKHDGEGILEEEEA